MHTWTRFLVQVAIAVAMFVVTAMLSRAIYLLIVQPPEAGMEEVRDIENSKRDCTAPDSERGGSKSSDDGLVRATRCLEA